MADFTIDPAAVNYLLNTPEGPTGVFTSGLGARATSAARARAPVMKPKNFSSWGKMYNPERQYGPPGMTKAKIYDYGIHYNRFGQIYTGVNAPFFPTVFLEIPAKQVSEGEYAFMSQARDSLAL